jgi:hypothetical protein
VLVEGKVAGSAVVDEDSVPAPHATANIPSKTTDAIRPLVRCRKCYLSSVAPTTAYGWYQVRYPNTSRVLER